MPSLRSLPKGLTSLYPRLTLLPRSSSHHHHYSLLSLLSSSKRSCSTSTTTFPNSNSNYGNSSSNAHNAPIAVRSDSLDMDAQTKQHYLADSPPTVVKLEIKSHFDNLKDEKLRKYAHFLSRLVL